MLPRAAVSDRRDRRPQPRGWGSTRLIIPARAGELCPTQQARDFSLPDGNHILQCKGREIKAAGYQCRNSQRDPRNRKTFSEIDLIGDRWYPKSMRKKTGCVGAGVGTSHSRYGEK